MAHSVSTANDNARSEVLGAAISARTEIGAARAVRRSPWQPAGPVCVCAHARARNEAVSFQLARLAWFV